MNPWQALWIIIIGAAITKAKDEIWQRKIPIKFLRAVMEQPNLCESAYADYDSCENAVSTNSVKSRSTDDVYEFNSEEVNIEKIIGDFMPVEEKPEKRSHLRAGCDCQLASTLIDLGPSSFPRHIRNVTCGEHNRCQYARAKNHHCLPIHYQVKTTFCPTPPSSNSSKLNVCLQQVSVIKMRQYGINPSELTDAYILPQGLRCRWKAMTIPTVVGCVCGPQY
ncbi:uncharacterized protein LOC129569135 isoform X2 [Sitodiplosis mosellana]|uniref:uncharacterized protein LOC129569135 isoform X2 n=1 Tax=Sitodiplosis mosellana TaxID=263140 RepID=UPI00244433C8|nr:uncharacterized protein LOC129569135 isoform X2 [Sitodiplosis mosellana]